ncbi:hypothetical protein KMZ29_02560 [Bradyrhizobium sediminis]|uniref:Uncharacterized protein n=1 Tax=Bradyrhizobium sediminis TaxID=2840469 RepID=A0A975NGC8_9BRAD|nr:hypothetical protein [Bradyrhizobium sediminis]QWG13639.1 hypothetical protein KMZ29_02560 [Bradyrhizobium sediminis]
MTPDDADNERARLNAEIAALMARVKKLEAERDALPKRKVGRPAGYQSPEESVKHNYSATRRVLSAIQRHEIAQRKLKLSVKVPLRKMDEFIEIACKAFPKAKAERVRTLVNIYRKSGEDKVFSGGRLKRLIADFDA